MTGGIRELRQLTVHELQRRYAEVFGEPTRVHHKDHLIKRIAWRMQAIEEGDLSGRARKRAADLADDAEVRLRAPRQGRSGAAATSELTAPFQVRGVSPLPAPGAILRREYKGRVLTVRVLSAGFEYDGEVFKSLSAIALKVTGSHWNGVAFFKLKPTRRRVTPEART